MKGVLAAAAVCAAGVSVLYMPQALLPGVAHDLALGDGTAGLFPAATQFGYALGILFFVPRVRLDKARRDVTAQLILLATATLVLISLPTFPAIVAAALLAGLLAATVQVVFTATLWLTPPGQAGHAASVLLAAVLIGSFGSRLLVGICDGFADWRLTFATTAVFVLLPLPFIRRFLDTRGRRVDHLVRGPSGNSYVAAAKALNDRRKIAASLGQALVFGGFNAIWAVSVLDLTSSPRNWSTGAAASLAVAGLAAAVFLPVVGRGVDRVGARKVQRILYGSVTAAGIVLAALAGSVVALVAALFVVTLGSQGSLSATQSAVVAGARLPASANAAFMFVLFLGGATGTAVGVQMYDVGGLLATTLFASGLFATATVLAWSIGIDPGPSSPKSTYSDLASAVRDAPHPGKEADG